MMIGYSHSNFLWDGDFFANKLMIIAKPIMVQWINSEEIDIETTNRNPSSMIQKVTAFFMLRKLILSSNSFW